MRKAMKYPILMALVLAVVGSGPAKAAVVGLEWGIGPTIPIANFGMKMNDGFTLAWKVTDTFAVGVFREAGTYRGEHEYSNDTVSPALKQSLIVQGTTEVSGIRLMATMPVINILQAGIELGTINMSACAAPTYSRSDGNNAAVTAADFGAPVAMPAQQLPVLGVTLRGTLIKGETKTVSTAIGIQAGFRFVDMPDAYYLGTQEVTTNLTTKKKIEAVTDYSNVDVALVVGLWF